MNENLYPNLKRKRKKTKPPKTSVCLNKNFHKSKSLRKLLFKNKNAFPKRFIDFDWFFAYLFSLHSINTRVYVICFCSLVSAFPLFTLAVYFVITVFVTFSRFVIIDARTGENDAKSSGLCVRQAEGEAVVNDWQHCHVNI